MVKSLHQKFMRVVVVFLWLISAVGWAQERPLERAIVQARTTGKTDTFPNLFTANGTTHALTNAQDTTQHIDKLTLNTNVLKSIRSQKRELLEISLPTALGTLELELVPVNLFAPGFNVVTHLPDTTFQFDASRVVYYQGMIKNNPRSLVALALSDENVVGLVSDSTGNRVLSRQRAKSASQTDYALYNEQAVQTKIRPFACNVADSGTSDLIETPSEKPTKQTNSSNCVKYVGIYLEADYALYQSYGGNITDLTEDILFVFDQVITLYRNENVYVQLSQLYVWNTNDPYSTATTSASALAAFKTHWNNFGNSFPGQIAHLMSSRSFSGNTVGLADGYNGLSDKSTAYSFNSSLNPAFAAPYPTYSWAVFAIAHELGHNFSSHHTHWCGWPGGPIDNCAVPENGPCSAGPAPVNGGTIMSYCHLANGVNFAKGFGTLPGNQIRNKIASVTLPITTSDGKVESINSGIWTMSGTWTCGVTPSVLYKATISPGHRVQLNSTGNAKTLTIQGTLNLSTPGTVIRIGQTQSN
ncbi:hypothetical protein IC229_16160 [Spirosoma sp. BT702]|uniref:Peptidase M12B domain-containing protein n=1 Tax=Spirosoma profusum TaxID=2771354 RepID=A0A926XWY6_9BACT|nr:M12 family metallo-peptidase [Spirosoma profusum]MBD2702187.1 hypothetical protein [Spirosoma profusum]